MIKAINITKSFGKQAIFDSISFILSPRERVGLVGRNGHGKTTLLRMIIDEELPDTGEIVIPKDYSIGYVTQRLDFSEENILKEGCLGLPEHHRDDTWRVEKVLSGLGFTKDDMLRDPNELSGGYQVRLNLAKVLVSEPDLLLLDEPTNYLDIVSIRWLENHLRQWEGELLLITHDRTFMDKVTTHTMGIHRCRIKKIEGSTDKYYEQILREEEIHEKTRINDEKKRKEAEQFITRFRAKARLAGMVQSRIKSLQKMEKLEKLGKIKTLEFSLSYKEFPAKVLMNTSNIAFSYNDEDLIRNFSINIGKNDRICVIGKNGKGKTTLLRLLAGELAPQQGEIKSHGETGIGHFAQTNTKQLNDYLTIEEEILKSGCDRQKSRNICGAMMFGGDTALKKIEYLSGGEKSRVLLGKILASKSNLLLLDEPTNHLDMESCDALLAAIDEFRGAVMIVTHNEMFLHTLANRFVVFQGGGISLFEGTYHDFLRMVGWEDEKQPVWDRDRKEKDNTVNRKDLRKLRADILSRKSKSAKPLAKKILELERFIEEREEILKDLNMEMVDASESGNGNEITRLSIEIHNIKSGIDADFEELDAATKEFESMAKSFDQELERLEV